MILTYKAIQNFSKDQLANAFPLERATVIAALTHLREEWEEAADGQPLKMVKGNVGMLFEDVLDAIGLTELEKGLVCGLWRKGYE